MSERQRPVVAVVLIAVILVAVGLLVWQWLGARATAGVAESVYPQPMAGQPTVEQVGPPPDVVPAGTPGAPTLPPKGR
ncbi:MAG: hypothetical protein NZM10_04520 [Fimbriimonadales bacterium]|nr:hypothetical protein [Fimbriimonadales bacterium]